MNINQINTAISKLNPFNSDNRKELKVLYKMRRKLEAVEDLTVCELIGECANYSNNYGCCGKTARTLEAGQ